MKLIVASELVLQLESKSDSDWCEGDGESLCV